MPEVAAEICRVHQAIENVVGMMADPRQVRGQPQVVVAALVALGQVQLLPPLGKDVMV